MAPSPSLPCPPRTPALLAASLILALALACSSSGPADIDSTPPPPPALKVDPNAGTVGFPVYASVQGASSFLRYQWTLAPGTFPGGAAKATGANVTFFPGAAGTFTLTCVAIKGTSFASTPAQVQVPVADPPAGAGGFTPAGALVQARDRATAAVLADGSVLVFGGAATPAGTGLASAERYVFATRLSTSLPATLTRPRAGQAMAPLDATRFLLVGGAGAVDSPGSADVYSTLTGLFTATAPPGAARALASATPLGDAAGTVLVAGGLSPQGNPVADAEAFAGSAFTAAGTLALAPGHTATLLADGRVLLVGHQYAGPAWIPFAALARRDPGTGTWTFTPTSRPPGAAREWHQALRVGSRVLVLGGDGGAGPLASAEWYDPVTDAFSPCPTAMASPRRDFAAVVLPGGKVLLLGGSADGSTATGTAELFDPAAQTFTPTGALGAPRRDPLALVLPASGRVLVLGGYNEAQGCLGGIEVY